MEIKVLRINFGQDISSWQMGTSLVGRDVRVRWNEDMLIGGARCRGQPWLRCDLFCLSPSIHPLFLFYDAKLILLSPVQIHNLPIQPSSLHLRPKIIQRTCKHVIIIIMNGDGHLWSNQLYQFHSLFRVHGYHHRQWQHGRRGYRCAT